MASTTLRCAWGLLLTSCAAGLELSPVSSIVNPSFEAGFEGWTAGPEGAAARISESAKAGDRSVSLKGPSAFVSQVVAVRSAATYRLSAAVRGRGSVGVKVGSDIYFDQAASSRWKTLEVIFRTETATIVSVFGGGSDDEVLFDRFELFEVLAGPARFSPRLRSSRSGGYGLSPDLAPGQNFELVDWYLTIPEDRDHNGKSDRVTEAQLVGGWTDRRYFWTAPDGGMVLRTTVAGARTSKNTKFTRTELREMLRRGDKAIRTKLDDGRPNKNNWVFSSAPAAARAAAGGVDGKLRATLAVNHVTTTGRPDQVGRVIVGQIHAKDDEPARLYYRKLPGHARGSLYVAHEPSGGDDIFYKLLGSRTDDASEPEDGIELDEKFTYEIEARGDTLTVRILQGSAVRAMAEIDMSKSGYDVADDYMYFKAGVYNQNNSGAPDDFDQATFYELVNSHDMPAR